MIGLLLAIACATGPRSDGVGGAVAQVQVRKGDKIVRLPDIMYRPIEPPNADARWLVDTIGIAQWDAGLSLAAQELVASIREPQRLLKPRAMAVATARAGFPGVARFARVLNDGAPPATLMDGILNGSGGNMVDVGLAKRSFADGGVLWIVGWAPHVADVDPLPREVALDSGLTLRADLLEKGDAKLYISSPDGPVREVSISSGVARWVDGFIVPGEYRFEVLANRDQIAQLALLFNIYVDVEPPEVPPAPPVPDSAPDPAEAEAWLFEELNELRTSHGLQAVRRFELFEPLAREHSALMGHAGIVAHRLPGLGGVQDRAKEVAHPRARHFENVAAATDAADALSLVELSPAHLKNLLCETCSHVAIGAALEPVLDKMPRLFVTWELLEFPQGPPREIDHFNR